MTSGYRRGVPVIPIKAMHSRDPTMPEESWEV
jgi:hypothetical protein